MYSDDRSPDLEAGKGEKISDSDHMSDNSDSFVVDMNRFSHLTEKDFSNSNSRIQLQRNLSRKGSVRNGDLKITGNDGDSVKGSPRASTMPEKPRFAVEGPTDHSHHQITIGGGGSSAASGAAAESKSVGRKFSFRRSHPMRIGNPKRILILFATLSSMGTILLIYFTLSMAKHNRENDASIS